MSPKDLFVGLARTRTVVVLDTATDDERRRISLAALGAKNIPWRIGVGANGTAAVVPLSTGAPQVGVIASRAAIAEKGQADLPRALLGTRDRRGGARAADEECAAVAIGTGRTRPQTQGAVQMAESLAADGRGRAYVLIGDGGALEPSYAAVVDLRRSATLRHLPLAPVGETVLTLAGEPEGDRLFASIWTWDDPSAPLIPGFGRLVSLDTRTGTPLDHASLSPTAAVTDITLATGGAGTPGGARRLLYAVVADPGPSRFEDDWWLPQTRYFLAALDLAHLDPVGWWPLEERPTSVTVTPDGGRAFLLKSAVSTSQLSCLDLVTGTVTDRWPLPAACFGLALSPVGKAYVADPFGDHLWRVDTSSNSLLTPLPIVGAPIALAAA